MYSIYIIYIQNMSHFSSNIPRTIPSGVITGQMVRFARICSSFDHFIANFELMAAHMVLSRGYPKTLLRRKALEFVRSSSPYRIGHLSQVRSLKRVLKRL